VLCHFTTSLDTELSRAWKAGAASKQNHPSRRRSRLSPTMKVVFDANNPSLWAFHRHNLFHMVAGMFATVVYDGFS
jgi:FtsP/CotA-like multicopper oxidase with cupredoxin domain